MHHILGEPYVARQCSSRHTHHFVELTAFLATSRVKLQRGSISPSLTIRLNAE